MPRIAVYSLSRSGSTLLNYLLTQSLPDCYNLFEPKSLNTDFSHHSNLVAKVVLDAHHAEVDYRGFKKLDTHVRLIRDPRDQLISAFLFGIHGRPQREFNECMQLLRRKEQSPSRYPFWQLVLDTHVGLSREALVEQIALRRRLIDDSYFANNQILTYRYEQLINQQYVELESYLGFSLVKEPQIPNRHSYAKRAAVQEQWKHWFTDEDVVFFEPLLSSWLRRFDYVDEWALHRHQRIKSIHCSEFVSLARRRKYYFKARDISWSDEPDL